MALSKGFIHTVETPPILATSQTLHASKRKPPASSCLLPCPWHPPIFILSLWTSFFWTLPINGTVLYVTGHPPFSPALLLNSLRLVRAPAFYFREVIPPHAPQSMGLPAPASLLPGGKSPKLCKWGAMTGSAMVPGTPSQLLRAATGHALGQTQQDRRLEQLASAFARGQAVPT